MKNPRHKITQKPKEFTIKKPQYHNESMTKTNNLWFKKKNWEVKVKKKEEEKKQVINCYVEVLYSALEDLKQSKSERKEKKKEKRKKKEKVQLPSWRAYWVQPRFPLPTKKKKRIQNQIFGPQCQAESKNVIKSLILVGPLLCWLLRLNTCFATWVTHQWPQQK